MFCLISKAHSGPIFRICFEFGPGRDLDPSRTSNSPNIACNMGSSRKKIRYPLGCSQGWSLPLPVFYHTFCTSGAFRLDETSYHELKPCKLPWFLHFRTGPPRPQPGNRSEIGPKVFPKNKTKQNAATMSPPRDTSALLNRRILFCFVLFCWLARVVDQPGGEWIQGGVRGGAKTPLGGQSWKLKLTHNSTDNRWISDG